jgi:predicted nucleic acid-binding protein
MILLDTNVLIALVDERDRLHAKARRDLRKLKGPYAVTSVVLSECCFLLTQAHQRQRLAHLLKHLRVEPIEPEAPWWRPMFDWLAQYAEHDPDLCDAMLVLLAGRHALPVWTYDSEFRKLWRKPDGKPVQVIPARA